MKKNINALSQIIAEKLNENNVRDIAGTLWFELQIDKRTGQLDYLLDKVRERIAKANKKIVVYVSSSEALTGEELLQISIKLEKKYDRKIEIKNRVDVNMLGGLKIQVGDEIIDLSWREKLNGIITKMVGENG